MNCLLFLGKAELEKATGKKLTFKVTANDEEGEIGFGKHVGYVNDQKKFMEKYGYFVLLIPIP